MLFKTIALLFTASAVLANGCHNNNCDRAVMRTWQGTAVFAQHMSDCANSLACSSTPAATTTTKTAYVTAGVVTMTVAKETATPAAVAAVSGCVDNIPSDVASQCEWNFAMYKDACNNCAAITGSTSIAPTPEITAMVTHTIPSSVVYV
jgi:hypothetical protein